RRGFATGTAMLGSSSRISIDSRYSLSVQSYLNLFKEYAPMSNMALLRRCWQHRRRLRSHLIMLVLAALLPLVLFSICMIIGFAQGERRTAERGMRETARALALAVDREVGEVHAALGILSLSR